MCTSNVKMNLIGIVLTALTLILDFCRYSVATGSDNWPLSRKGRIAGGSTVSDANDLYIVSLQDSHGHYCAGTIITNKTILTAAHCIDRNFYVRVGIPDLEVEGTKHEVVGIKVHDSYRRVVHQNSRYALNDLALVKVEPTITMSKNIQQAKLLGQNQTVSEGESATIMGWGATRTQTEEDLSRGNYWDMIKSLFKHYDMEHYYTKNLKQSELIIVGPEICEDYFSRKLQNQLCAFRKSTGVCRSDSGGPLDISGFQVGIVSSGGAGCGRNNSPSVFVNLSLYRDWIDQNVKILESTPEEKNFLQDFFDIF